jgi:hypothetical protein
MIGLLILSMGSCKITFVVNKTGYYSNYDKLTNLDKKSIVFLSAEDTIATKCKDTSIIYAVNALQLQAYMEQYDSCLVYAWNQECHGKYCVFPMAIEQYCQKNHYKYIILLRKYSSFDIVRDAIYGQFPVFSINEQYYQTNEVAKYESVFKQTLSVPPITDKKYSTFWIFKQGKFEKFENGEKILTNKQIKLL